MEALQNFAYETYDPKKFEKLLKGIREPIRQADIEAVRDNLLNPTAVFLLPAVGKSTRVQLAKAPDGSNVLPVYTSRQVLMQNIYFDVNSRLIPCNIAMLADIMEKNESISALSLNFVEVPGTKATGLTISRDNILAMKEPYLKITEAVKKLAENGGAQLVNVTAQAPDEVLLAQIRAAASPVLQKQEQAKSCYVCQASRVLNGKEQKSIFYILNGTFASEEEAALKAALKEATGPILTADWEVEIYSADSELGKKLCQPAVEFYRR